MLLEMMMNIGGNMGKLRVVQMTGMKGMRPFIRFQVIEVGAQPREVGDVDQRKSQLGQVGQVSRRRIKHQKLTFVMGVIIVVAG